MPSIYKYSFRILMIFIVMFPLSAQGQLIPYNGSSLYLNGPNVAWNNYGWDFGDNPQGWGGGNGYSSTWWENHFAQLESYGANSARIWIHCKGENNPLFDVNNNCTGVNSNFYNNLDDMLDRAKNHHIMVLLCLWDFHVVDYLTRKDVLLDTNKTRLYINNALIPIVKRYKKQCNLLGYEIINEPEWIMSGVSGAGNHGGAPISISQMQRFVGACAEAIHKHSAKYATVGSACLKWSSGVFPALRNYWSDEELFVAYHSNNSYLDFYQVHYYDWMYFGYCPYNRLQTYWEMDKPTLIGESGNTGYFNYQQQYDLGYSNGFAGTMIWASSASTGGAATWTQFNNQMKNFRDNHSSLVDFDCVSLPVQLVSFSIKDSVEIVKIRWSVLNETNHDHYFVERKDLSGTTDLLNVFLDSTDVAGVKYYSLNDTLSAPGIYNYRLVEVTTSAVANHFLWYRVGVQTPLFTSLLEKGNTKENVLNRILTSGEYTLSLFDLQGRSLLQKQSSGENYKEAVAEFVGKEGMFVIELKSDSDVFREKILVR